MTISWCNAARKLRYVKSQEEMDLAKKDLESTYSYKFDSNSRKLAFYARWHLSRMVFKFLFGIFQFIKQFLLIGIPFYLD